MAEYLTDDEELEKFKRWWKESGQQLLLLIVIAAGGYYGWQFWQDRQQTKAEAGFRVYQQLLEVAQAEGSGKSVEEQQQLTHLAVKLKEEQSGSQYAYFASLTLARQAVENQDYQLAARELNNVIDNADPGLAAIARLRLAYVEAEQSGPDDALSVLEADVPEQFSASYEEARGDFYLLKGETEAARDAYLRALSQLDESAQQKRGILSLKLNQVAPVTPAKAQEGNS